jgi:glycosyltransferase involved in cell wall biosynthesis
MYRYSIILPVRNGGDYVKECVHSILAQTLPEFNLHVLDNASTDGTADWIRSLGDPRIILEPSNRSLTIEENWGRILSVRKNEFITLIGHDDILDPHYLAVMNDLIARHPRATLYQTHFRFIDSKGELIRRSKPMDEVQQAHEYLSIFLADMIDVMGTGFMMRARDYDEAGGLPAYPNLLFADFELWLSLTKRGYKATAYQESFAFRRHLSTTTTSADIKMHVAFARFVDFLAGLRQTDPLAALALDRYGIQYMQAMSKGLAHRLLRTPIAKRGGRSVGSFLDECRRHAGLLAPGQSFDPEATFSVRLGRWIDGSALTRQAFLLFKRFYSKPLYN